MQNKLHNITKDYELERVAGEFLDYKFEVFKNQNKKVNISIRLNYTEISKYINFGSSINEGIQYAAQLIKQDIEQRIYRFNKKIIEMYEKYGCSNLEKLIKGEN